MFSAQRWVIRVQNQLSHLSTKQFDDQNLRADIRDPPTANGFSAICRLCMTRFGSRPGLVCIV
jgi:hypothetical protein